MKSDNEKLRSSNRSSKPNSYTVRNYMTNAVSPLSARSNGAAMNRLATFRAKQDFNST